MPTNDVFDMAWAASKDEEVHKGIFDRLNAFRTEMKQSRERRETDKLGEALRGRRFAQMLGEGQKRDREAEERGISREELERERQLEEEVVNQIRGNTHNQVFADDDDGIQNSVDALPLENPFANPFSNPNAFAIKEPRKDVPAEYITPIVKAEPPQEKPDIGIDVVEGDDLSLLPASLFPRNTPGGDNMSLLPSGWNSD
tara:strand:- start:386 stop:985 length:600 start_codon:yes stop_codon:yes gene_type:complete